MILVLDTNVAISGLLWPGAPNTILKLIHKGQHTLLLSNELIDEFKKVAAYHKFKDRLKMLAVNPEQITVYYQNLGRFVPILKRKKYRTLKDQGDNIFLDLALNGKAQLIISGDTHLLSLISCESIPIVMPSEALRIFDKIKNQP